MYGAISLRIRRWAIVVGGLVMVGIVATTIALWPGRPSPSTAEAADGPAAGAENAKGTTESWRLFRGDPQASGVSTTFLPEQPTLLWKKSFKAEDESFEATATIDKTLGKRGMVFVGGFNGPLYAFDLATGEEKWRFKTEAGFNASASIRGGLLYVGDVDGVFYCLDAATGEKKWTFAPEDRAEISNGANFYKDRVVFGSQNATLYCLQADTGMLVWKHQIADQIRCFPTIVGNRCFVAGCDGVLHMIDLDTGKPAEGVPLETPTGCSPAVLGDMAFVGTESDTFFGINWRMAKTVWTYEHASRTAAYRASAAVTKDVVVIANLGRFLAGLAPDTGKQLWTFNTRSAIDGSPVIVGQRAFFGTSRGRLYAVDIKSGKATWEHVAGGGFLASPAIAAGRMVIASDDGVVYCFGAK